MQPGIFDRPSAANGSIAALAERVYSVREIYQRKLTMAYKPGRYKPLIKSPLFAERCASLAVPK